MKSGWLSIDDKITVLERRKSMIIVRGFGLEAAGGKGFYLNAVRQVYKCSHGLVPLKELLNSTRGVLSRDTYMLRDLRPYTVTFFWWF